MLWLQKQARPFSMWNIRQTEPGKVGPLLSVRIWTERSSSLVSGLGRVQVTGERHGVRRGRGREKYRQTDRERKKEEASPTMIQKTTYTRKEGFQTSSSLGSRTQQTMGSISREAGQPEMQKAWETTSIPCTTV